MQEAVLTIKKDSLNYQIPYRLEKRSQVDNDLLIDALVSGRLILDAGPEIISFEDDPTCNLSCPSCRKAILALTPEQSLERVESDVKLLDAVGAQAKEFWFSGAGDPFASSAYRKLFQNYDFDKFPNIRFRLDTNGILFNEHTWNTVLGKINQRIKLIAVSVDAASEETYESIRQGGNFRTLIENLRFISDLPERKQGMAFIIRMIVQQKNYREMRPFIELGRSLGVDGVVFSVIQNWGTYSDKVYQDQAVHLPTHPEYKEFCNLLKDPVFKEPMVDLGNLIELYNRVIAHDDMPHRGTFVSADVAGKHIVTDAPRKARVIAFYLPQFHPIPENDVWWGKGFTEWTNVGKAKPLFEGHYQPHVPADLGYYDLRVPETRQAQADLARSYGIEAFCYWHYWFAGHQLLERPFDEVIKTGQPDFPFCLGWANQTWSGIWHGAPDRVLIEQTYPGLEDYKAHFDKLLPAFRDPRYLRVHGRPLFVIYAPTNLSDACLFTSYWQELAQKAGLDGMYFVAHNVRNPEAYGCQACVDNAPFVSMNAPMVPVSPLSGGSVPKVSLYEDLVQYLKQYQLTGNEYPLVVPNWDNTPRSGSNGFVLQGSTPELFREMLDDAVQKVAQKPDPAERIVFIKAWNEWAEGNHLEPDLLHGHRYLEAVKESIFLTTGVTGKGLS
ncbi:MAG: glycoside hydrolase family 99-like domain-containing protein [Verrucomicrobia bacterium]|nr:glycoside hydrolase family 99-like domain-containing protein [Deltaproteobacteria bacterium]